MYDPIDNSDYPKATPPVVPEYLLQKTLGHVPDDARCLRCSYALRGLGTGGTCPECGTPIVESLQGNKLRFANPEYLKKLHVGSFVMLLCVAVYLLMTFVGIAVMIQSGGMGSNFVEGLLQLTSLGIYVGLLYGTWIFSAADPAYIGTDSSSTSRKIVRVCITIIGVGQVLSLIIDALAPFSTLQLFMAPIVLAVLGAFIVLFFATQAYIMWLANRIPDAAIAKRASHQRWILPLLAVGPMPLVVVSVVVLLFVGWLFFFAWLISTCIALILWWNNLDRLRRQLKAIRFGN